MRDPDPQSAVGGCTGQSRSFDPRYRLPEDSAANVSQILTLDRDILTECVGKLPPAKLELVLAGIDVILGRERRFPR